MPMALELNAAGLSNQLFAKIADTVYRLCGINLPPGKEELVKVRLGKRLRALGLGSYKAYLDLVQRDAQELALMIDALTTNKTSFFREPQHFEFLRQHAPSLLTAKRVRLWSAGCSSGEEPFTLAIVLSEAFSDLARRDLRILATDLSSRMVARVREAVYDEEVLREVPAALLQKYFERVPTKEGPAYRASEALRSLVRVAQLNLMEPWPMKGPFDAIFCRNVMIYFDKATQGRLVQRFGEYLKPGGHLFVGHSESLTGLSHELRYVKPAVYVK